MSELAEGLVEVLANDVERLRTLNSDLLWRLTSAECDAVELACKADRLAAENADLAERIDALESDRTFAAAEAKVLRTENAATKHAYETIVAELAKRNATLTWFEHLWPLAAIALDRLVNLNRNAGGEDPEAVLDMWAFLGENPKP